MITNIKHFKENFVYSIPQVQPATKDELIKIINSTIEHSQKGNEVDLNFIDTSLITDMSWLFHFIKDFNGDISNWNVSNVKNMYAMFYTSEFNEDISNWDTSNVTNMQWMFYNSKFNQDISKWDVSNVTHMHSMFNKSQFNQDISNWDVSYVTNMKDMFYKNPLKSNPPHWYKNK